MRGTAKSTRHVCRAQYLRRRGLLRRALLIAAFASLLLMVAAAAAAGAHSAAGGKTLVELDSSVAPSLDPDGANSSDNAMHEAFVNLMDGLVGNPTTLKNGVLVPSYTEGDKGFTPQLATSWTHKGNVWVFNLRKGVVGCTGDPFTSADVVYTFARGKSVSGASNDFDFLLTVSGVFTGKEGAKGATAAQKALTDTEVKALGPYKVQVTQLGPNPLLLPVLTTFGTRIFDSKLMKAHATKQDPWSHNYNDNINAPGFGPYCLTKWTKGSEMDFTANPKYWRGVPPYTNVVLRAVPSDANRTASVIGGQANVATGLTPRENGLVAKSSSAGLLGFSNNVELSLGINYRYPPFNDVAKGRLIRQAMAYAVPYNQIIQQDYLGAAKRAYGLAAPNSVGYVPIKSYSTNLAKAKSLMAKAGYPDGKGLPKNSPAFQLFWTAEESTLLQPIANQIRTALAQIGITVSLHPIPQASEASRETVTHDMGMFLRGDLRPFVPDIGYDALLFDVSSAKGGLVDSTNWSNPTFDKLYKQSATEVGSARMAVLAKLQRIEMTELPLIPLVVSKSQLAVSKGITNWLGNSNDNVYWWFLKS